MATLPCSDVLATPSPTGHSKSQLLLGVSPGHANRKPTGKSVTLLVPTSMLLLFWHLQNAFCQEKHLAKLDNEPFKKEEEMPDPQVSDEQV